MDREVKRLEQFRQLRREIRGSYDMLVVGIDISKDQHNALMRTVSGKVYRRLTFHNTRDGFETLLVALEAVRVEHGLNEVVLGMEPTANYHKPLGEFLINRDQQVVLVSLKQPTRIARCSMGAGTSMTARTAPMWRT